MNAKTNKHLRLLSLLFIAASLLFSSCTPDNNNQDPPTEQPHGQPDPLTLTVTPPSSQEKDIFFTPSDPLNPVTEVQFPVACTPLGCTKKCYIDAAPPEDCGDIYKAKVRSGKHTLHVDANLGTTQSKSESVDFVRIADPITMTVPSQSTLYTYAEVGKLAASCNSSLPCTLTCDVTSGSVKETLPDCTVGRVFDFTSAPFSGPKEVVFHVKACVTVDGTDYCTNKSKKIEFKEPSWTKVSSGRNATCAIREDRTLWCWGSRDDGMIPDGQATTGSTPPIHIGDQKWVDVSLGFQHGCAIREDRTLWCWGHRDFGDLGSNGLTSGVTSTPEQVKNPLKWSQVSAGHNITCGLSENWDLYCWGQNTNQLLGVNATKDEINAPQKVVFADGMPHSTTSVTAGDNWIAAQVAEGGGTKVYTWGKNIDNRLGIVTLDSSNHRVADSGDKTQPTQMDMGSVPSPHDVQLSLGATFACGIFDFISDKILQCWGDNAHDTLALSSGATSSIAPTPNSPPYKYNAVSVSKTNSFACAIDDTKHIACWGNNGENVVAPESSTAQFKTPTPISALSGIEFSQLSVGSTHACALTSDETHAIWCWGSYADNRLGQTATSPAPQKVKLQ